MVQSDVLQTSKQHLLFSNSILIGLKGNVRSSGLTHVIPLPVIVWHGTNDVLLGFSTSDTIPVCPGNNLMLFVAIKGIEICHIFICESECSTIIKIMILDVRIAKNISVFMFTLGMNSHWLCCVNHIVMKFI